MKKAIGILLVIVMILALIYFVYIFIEQNNFSKNAGARPAITLYEEKSNISETAYREKYKGLGYEVEYYYTSNSEDPDNNFKLSSGKFILFEKYNLAAWTN
jgi:hypothetical protein